MKNIERRASSEEGIRLQKGSTEEVCESESGFVCPAAVQEEFVYEWPSVR